MNMDSLSIENQLAKYQSTLQAIQQAQGLTSASVTPTDASKFSDVLSRAIGNLNSNMDVVSQDTQNVITGKETDLGSVMTRMTEAQLALQTAVQVRNKALEAYNDLKNMQF